jgi:glycosyltransferase involved in cell wall biosynthesis
MKNKKVLILYSCLSDYILNILSTYTTISGTKLHIIYLDPVKSEAPFELDLENNNINFYKYNQFDQNELIEIVQKINPNLIISSGWNHKKYNGIINVFHKKIKCILTMDNQWLGKPRQYLGLLYSRFFIVNKYNKIWVPGAPQMEYALKLGFKKKNILSGWYVANEDKFKLNHPRNKVSKQFVFVGRYVDYKGILDLYQAFVRLVDEVPNKWMLNCIGIGPLQDKFPEHPQIKHHGFMQPNQLQDFAKDGGVFVLPSHFEPWGLVVQEFALSGFPLLVSDKVGSASQFVSPENGIVFENNSVDSLFNALKTIVSKDDNELIEMSHASQKLGASVSYENWIKILNSELEDY